MSESKGLKEWRSKQKRGAIMKPETFKSIVSSCKKRSGSKESCTKQAGRAYWNAAEKKYAKRKK